ncbi:MAG: hypothetical protein II295_00410 [Akkermansia sp.]|nr:hypothetical protein [Akkermansia sp.]
MNTKFLRRATQLAENAWRQLRKVFRPQGRPVRCALRATARALTSRSLALYGLSLLIVAELCVLGVGVVRKLDVAAERTNRAAELYMAAVEAKAFSEQMLGRSSGVADIGAKAPATAEKKQEPEAGNEAPPLQPRDTTTIVWEETGELPDEEPVVTPAARPDTPAGPTLAEPVDAEGNQLGEEDLQELESLIRKAVAALVSGDIRLCIMCLEQGTALAPEYPPLLYYYGMAYDKLLNPDKARDFYTRVFSQRDKAGKYFERASRRLTYGMEQPSAMRGKLSFGPPLMNHTYDEQGGDSVALRLPIMLAPGEEVRVEDILIRLRFFVLVNNRKIEFSSIKPVMQWENETQSFENYEENLIVTYNLPLLDEEEQGVYGTRRFYGYTAKLYYRGEPLDCMSTPSALVLHEQMLDARAAQSRLNNHMPNSLLPDDGYETDDGLVPLDEEELPFPDDEEVLPVEAREEEAEDEQTPFSRWIEEIDPSE